VIAVAVLKRRLREGKSYEDFRRAWFHSVGFGAPNQMLTFLNVADPREVIVIALTEATLEDAERLIAADAAERAASPLDEVIEPDIERMFGILVAEDDFSASGPINYRAPSVGHQETDLDEVQHAIDAATALLAPYLRGSPLG